MIQLRDWPSPLVASCGGQSKSSPVKRKAERWARRYRLMPQAERIAMLGAIMGVEAKA
ncbi:MAG: hypothetical protein OXF20_12070 [Gammaproteobacteria bacterium]|nr:hypothetical protein [Gammaproteobacteria bacterium]